MLINQIAETIPAHIMYKTSQEDEVYFIEVAYGYFTHTLALLPPNIIVQTSIETTGYTLANPDSIQKAITQLTTPIEPAQRIKIIREQIRNIEITDWLQEQLDKQI